MKKLIKIIIAVTITSCTAPKAVDKNGQQVFGKRYQYIQARAYHISLSKNGDIRIDSVGKYYFERKDSIIGWHTEYKFN